MELPALSRLSNLVRCCGKSVLLVIGKPGGDPERKESGSVEEVNGHLTPKASSETLMEIYGARGQMRQSSPPDSRRDREVFAHEFN